MEELLIVNFKLFLCLQSKLLRSAELHYLSPCHTMITLHMNKIESNSKN